jgi:hypothetical protein
MGLKPPILRDAALEYAARGWAVFPCKPRGKRPLCPHGLKDATTDEAQIRAWWERWPDANIGYPTGNRVVLDVDGAEGENSLADLQRANGRLPQTLTAKTGRGRHLYFKPNGAKIRNSAGKPGKHLDIRAEGGYVILPPSIHENGWQYRWEVEAKPAPLPAWIVEKCAESARKERSNSGVDDKIPEGQRNSYLTSLAGSMRRRGMGEAAIEAALLKENQERCNPPLSDEEVKKIAHSVGRYEPAKQPDVKGFKLVPLAELLAKPDVPVEYIWEGRLAAGTVSAIVSKPKVGKSTLARGLCLAVARGQDYLGFPTKQGECIYLALEERGEDVRNDFLAMGADGSEPILIHAAAAPAEGIRGLCELVKERRPCLVVIDPLFRIARVRDENAYAETYAALGPLIDAARESGAHVMLVHHSGKGVKADPIDSPLGSTAIGGAASTVIVLKRTEDYRVIQTVQRIGQNMPETVLQFDPGTKRLSVGGTREDVETETLSREILDSLQAAGEPKTEPEITEAVGGATKFVRRALRQLVEQGKVSREGGGKRGDPYRYQFSFSCSCTIAGTRKQETQKPDDTRMNTERNLVPALEQKSFLVPGTEAAIFAPPKQGFGEQWK